jgi:hypothetical protein
MIDDIRVMPLWQKIFSSIANVIVSLWPAESKDWAHAISAELDEIESPIAASRWLFGGLMLLTRERFKFFLRSLSRPLGVAPEDPASLLAKDLSPSPRFPRFVTALFLLASLALLAFPEVRASLSSVLFPETRVRWDIQKLDKQVQISHDPQLLAFLSFLSREPAKRMQLADEAVRRDPSLVWIFYCESYWHYADTDRRHFPSDEKIAQLQASDPQNAVLLLLNAEIISHPVQYAYFSTPGSRPANENPSWETGIAKNPAWLAAMDHAFSAPKVDLYWSRQINLIRDVSNRYRVHDPDLSIFAITGHRVLDFSDIHAYADFLLTRGDESARRGNTSAAAAGYQSVERFAEKLSGVGSYGLAEWLATQIGAQAERRLVALYGATNRPAQAQIAAAQLAAWGKSHSEMNARWAGKFSLLLPHPWSTPQQAGLLINLSVFSVAILFPITIFVLLGVCSATCFTRRNLGRSYRLVCLAADFAPLLLAASFALLFFAYHPYAKFYSAPEQLNGTLKDIPAFYNFVGVTHNLPPPVEIFVRETLRIHSDYFLWLTFTAALSALALFLLVRLLRPRRASIPC